MIAGADVLSVRSCPKRLLDSATGRCNSQESNGGNGHDADVRITNYLNGGSRGCRGHLRQQPQRRLCGVSSHWQS